MGIGSTKIGGRPINGRSGSYKRVRFSQSWSLSAIGKARSFNGIYGTTVVLALFVLDHNSSVSRGRGKSRLYATFFRSLFSVALIRIGKVRTNFENEPELISALTT
jgi:hypothetical protein